MLRGALDNDVLLKGACYALLAEMIGVVCNLDSCGILGTAKFVIPKTLTARGRTAVANEFLRFVESFAILEPDPAEIAVAAQLEIAAQRAGLNLDEGESLLSAIVSARQIPWLATGDKRAIIALENLLSSITSLESLRNKLISLEQIFKRLVLQYDAARIRSAVCANIVVDKALTICFGCHGAESDKADWLDALDSYINDLRRSAPSLLSP